MKVTKIVGWVFILLSFIGGGYIAYQAHEHQNSFMRHFSQINDEGIVFIVITILLFLVGIVLLLLPPKNLTHYSINNSSILTDIRNYFLFGIIFSLFLLLYLSFFTKFIVFLLCLPCALFLAFMAKRNGNKKAIKIFLFFAYAPILINLLCVFVSLFLNTYYIFYVKWGLLIMMFGGGMSLLIKTIKFLSPLRWWLFFIVIIESALLILSVIFSDYFISSAVMFMFHFFCVIYVSALFSPKKIATYEGADSYEMICKQTTSKLFTGE